MYSYWYQWLVRQLVHWGVIQQKQNVPAILCHHLVHAAAGPGVSEGRLFRGRLVCDLHRLFRGDRPAQAGLLAGRGVRHQGAAESVDGKGQRLVER